MDERVKDKCERWCRKGGRGESEGAGGRAGGHARHSARGRLCVPLCALGLSLSGAGTHHRLDTPLSLSLYLCLSAQREPSGEREPCAARAGGGRPAGRPQATTQERTLFGGSFSPCSSSRAVGSVQCSCFGCMRPSSAAALWRAADLAACPWRLPRSDPGPQPVQPTAPPRARTGSVTRWQHWVRAFLTHTPNCPKAGRNSCCYVMIRTVSITHYIPTHSICIARASAPLFFGVQCAKWLRSECV